MPFCVPKLLPCSGVPELNDEVHLYYNTIFHLSISYICIAGDISSGPLWWGENMRSYHRGSRLW